MWSLGEALQKFIESLELTERQQEEVSRQHTVVREALRKRLAPKTDFLSGSYSRNTAIRPLHDIDIFVVLGQSHSTLTENPDAVLKRVRQALKEQWPEKELPILQQHSVHIEFSTSGIEFDVVPAFELAGQPMVYVIPERQTERQTERWVRTNPQLHAKLSTKANAQAGQKLKPLLKAVKHWNRQQDSSPLRSFHLEAMSYEAFSSPPAGYLEGLEALFSHLSQRVRFECPDPAGLGRPVDERMTPTQREAARQLLASAAETMRRVLAERQHSPEQAHARLRKLFGDAYRYQGP